MSGATRATSERGQATVEFAIVLPLVLLLIVGLIEFGKAFNYWLDLNHLANETARWAAVDTVPVAGGNANTSPDVQDLQAYLASQVNTQELQDELTVYPPGECEAGDDGYPYCRIEVCYTPSVPNAPPTIGDAATVRVTVPYGLPLVSSVSSLANSLFGGSSTFGTVNLTGSSTVRLEQVPEGSGWTACA